MKPTTAIKAIGVTDPSAIRRLRDKFHTTRLEQQPSAQIEPADLAVIAKSAALVTAAPPVQEPASPPRAAPLRLVEPTKHAEPFAPIELGHGLAGLLPVKNARHDAIPVAALFFGFGLNAATAIFEQQMMLAQSMLKLPPIRDLVRSQIAITEFMLSVARPSPGHRFAH